MPMGTAVQTGTCMTSVSPPSCPKSLFCCTENSWGGARPGPCGSTEPDVPGTQPEAPQGLQGLPPHGQHMLQTLPPSPPGWQVPPEAWKGVLVRETGAQLCGSESQVPFMGLGFWSVKGAGSSLGAGPTPPEGVEPVSCWVGWPRATRGESEFWGLGPPLLPRGSAQAGLTGPALPLLCPSGPPRAQASLGCPGQAVQRPSRPAHSRGPGTWNPASVSACQPRCQPEPNCLICTNSHAINTRRLK